MPKRSFEAHLALAKPTESGCLIWPGYIEDTGYGRATYKGRRWWAHRLTYTLKVGPIPEGKVVCHTCDNRRCVNAAHMFIGTRTDNSADMIAKGRSAKGERHSQSKLTAKQVLQIKRDTRPRRIVAKEHGISIGTVGDILRGKTWTHTV